MRGTTANLNTGPSGRDPDCNMASSTRGANEERVHSTGAGPPAAKTPPVGGEAGPRDKGALPGVVAEESYMPNTTPGGTGEEASDSLSPPAPPPSVVNHGIESGRGGAKWSTGRRGIIRGPELWKLLKERLKDPNRPVFRSAWQDVDLLQRVLQALMVRLDLGGMGPLVVRALDPRCMTLVKKEVSEYSMWGSLYHSTSGGPTATSS